MASPYMKRKGWGSANIGYGWQPKPPQSQPSGTFGASSAPTTNTVVQNSTQAPPAPPQNSTQTTPLPWDAAYQQSQNNLQLGLNNTLAAIQGQVGALGRSYGFDASGNIDPNDPFGRAQLLQRAFDQQKTGNKNGYAARGQLYSGALQNAQDAALFNYQAQDSALRNEFAQAQAALNAQRAAAYGNYYQGLNDAAWQRVNAAIADKAAGGGPPPAAPAPVQWQPSMATPASYQPNSQQGWMDAFKATHGGLTPEEYNYLQALYKAKGGK